MTIRSAQETTRNFSQRDKLRTYDWSDGCGTPHRLVECFLEKYQRPERRCHRARNDQGGENLSPELTEYLKDRGVMIERTGTQQHQANGVAEAAQRLILERTQATLGNIQTRSEVLALHC